MVFVFLVGTMWLFSLLFPLSVRLRLPAGNLIDVETIHSAFKVTRDRDAQYNPPGRLRQYDLIIFDEVSQIDTAVWQCLQVALSELSPCPYLVFVGDFQQLQPIFGEHQLRQNLQEQEAAGNLHRVELQQHAAARSTDPQMLEFLAHARVHQPSRNCLEWFFEGRKLSRDLDVAARQAVRVEQQNPGKTFTFLTVTNRGAQALNLARLKIEFPEAARKIEAMEDVVVGDPAAEAGLLSLEKGMRVRLTRNLDKERGFVNGNMGVIVEMLTKESFIMRTVQGVLLLVHPIRVGNTTFVSRLHDVDDAI